MSKLLCSDFFAAANTFKGFKSFFYNIIDPIKFERIYILKGAPGSGKSTIMKKVGETFSESDLNVKKIHCSSDINSLDGVLLERNDRKVAILDGTAPHMMDPMYPGAVDIIVNLTVSFDLNALYKQREEIYRITESKKNAYKCAYEHLQKAGEVFHTLIEKFSIDFSSLADRNLDTSIGIDVDNSLTKYPYLISAFGKDGYYKANCNFNGVLHGISGDGISEYIFMDWIKKHVKQRNKTACFIPCALDENISDGIIVGNDLYVITNNSENQIDTSNHTIENVEEYNLLKSKYLYSLELSQKCFAVASEYHFNLERIYSSNINFEIIDNITQGIVKEIKNIFY